MIETYNLSIRQLRDRIKSKEYERLPINTKEKLINNKEPKIGDLVKNPIIIKNDKYEIISEKVLQKLILEDIPHFLEQLGHGFTFIKKHTAIINYSPITIKTDSLQWRNVILL